MFFTPHLDKKCVLLVLAIHLTEVEKQTGNSVENAVVGIMVF